MQVLGRRWRYNLGLQMARQFTAERLALLGEAAHVIHPVAGQGVNLSWRDVAGFAEAVVGARQLGLDVGSPAVLREIARRRVADDWLMAAVTHGLVRLFSNDATPLRRLRDLGLGAVNQNLVLAVQNAAAQRDIGAASSLAAFFRTMGGSAGVSALGAVLGHQVATSVATGLAKLGIPVEGEAGTIPDLDTLPGPVRAVFEAAYGDATGHVFLIAVPFALVALVCILLIRETPLRTTIARADELEGTSK